MKKTYPENVKHVYFIRHGESTVNKTNDIHQPPNTFLSKHGKKQSKNLGEYFLNKKIDCIITSTYQRAKETGEIIQQILSVPLTISPLFIERKNPSSIVGKPYNDPKVIEIKRQIKNHQDKPTYHYEDEENMFDQIKRARKALSFLARLPEERIIVVTHEHFLKRLFTCIGHGDSSMNISKEGTKYTVKNANIVYCTYKRTWNIERQKV